MNRLRTTRKRKRLEIEYQAIRALLASGTAARLREVPGVSRVSVGLKEIKDEVVFDQLCIRVYVNRKRAIEELSTEERVPPFIGSIPTDVISRAPSVAACGDNGYKATLTPGIQIGNEIIGEGTLGCFGHLQGQPDSVVIISNQHVLYAGGAGANARIGQPSVTCSSCNRCGAIATNIGNGSNGWGQSFPAVTVEGTTYQVGNADCGAARLIQGVRPYSNRIPQIGMIAGTPPVGNLGVITNPAGQNPPHPDSIVRKYGIETGLTVGQVVQLSTAGPIFDEGGGTHALVEQILVMPLQGPSLGSIFDRRISFLDDGDSGSVVVNRHNQVIGLLRGRTRFFTTDELTGMGLPTNLGYFGVVTPIHRVMTILNIQIPANFENTVTTSGAVIDLESTNGIHALPATTPVTVMRQRLEETAGGKVLAHLIEKHRREMDRLLSSSRPVIVAWNRHHGPAWITHFINSINDETYVVPEVIKGVTQLQLLTRMDEVLNAHGSEGLRRDVARYRQTILDLAGASNIGELLEHLEVLDVSREEMELAEIEI